jgi:hypothetical protein
MGNNIKTDLKEIGNVDVDLINLAENAKLVLNNFLFHKRR